MREIHAQLKAHTRGGQQLELLETGATGKTRRRQKEDSLPNSLVPCVNFSSVCSCYFHKAEEHWLKQKGFLCPVNKNETMIGINVCAAMPQLQGRCACWGYL